MLIGVRHPSCYLKKLRTCIIVSASRVRLDSIRDLQRQGTFGASCSLQIHRRDHNGLSSRLEFLAAQERARIHSKRILHVSYRKIICLCGKFSFGSGSQHKIDRHHTTRANGTAIPVPVQVDVMPGRRSDYLYRNHLAHTTHDQADPTAFEVTLLATTYPYLSWYRGMNYINTTGDE